VAESSSSQQILITGASGLVGSALVSALEKRGHRVIRLARSPTPDTRGKATWNPDTGQIDLSHTGNLDAVVHLAGEPIAKRWTPEVKRRIRDSRVKGTRLLSEALARLPVPPKVLISASATGWYGDRGQEWLDETTDPGRGFLAETCREWETATGAARDAGVRVAQLRVGLVLSAKGGALAKMLPVFRLGLGGRLGDGRAWWSWIVLDDLLEVIQHALANKALHGPVNTVSPNPVSNAEFTKTLGRILHRPTLFPVPRFAVEMLFGEMGREAMLASFRVKPVKLVEAGFPFRFPELDAALRHLLDNET
jgi:uncharacterized protein (TIGR01777 family)